MNINYYITHGVSFIKRNVLYTVSFLLRSITKISPKRAIFWADNFNHYGCNPKYISEQLAHDLKDFEIIWVFKNCKTERNLPAAYQVVKFRSLRYLYYINTSKFVVTNQLIDRSFVLWKKRSSQKLIMTWHGTFALKKIMGDANHEYVFKERMTRECNSCDIILSDSDWFSQLLRRAFWYSGEILQKGIPRNDIFFNSNKQNDIAKKIRCKYKIESQEVIILYAPTFRNNGDETPYIRVWDEIIAAFEKKYGKKCRVLVRLHPNMNSSSLSREIISINNSIINVTGYDDMQELLCTANVLITDYSTCMFDFSLNNRPCYLFTPDFDTYDRGTYFPLESLPFSCSRNLLELLINIHNTNEVNVINRQNEFIKNIFSPILTNTASKEVVKWILKN